MSAIISLVFQLKKYLRVRWVGGSWRSHGLKNERPTFKIKGRSTISKMAEVEKTDRLSLACKKSARRVIECNNFLSFLVKKIFKGSLCRGVVAQSWVKKLEAYL